MSCNTWGSVLLYIFDNKNMFKSTRSLVVCVMFVDHCLTFCPFSFVIVWSVLRFSDSNYSFGIFELFLKAVRIDFFLNIKSCQYSMCNTNCR